ncbi:MAG: phosphohydrolase [Rhodocyclaceae bacterium]|nr:phosphohydrolase [Rhodocyclaceae bacterium]
MSMETQRLSASHVTVGHPLPGDVYDENGHMLLSSGFVIESESQLETLLARGMYVDIATFKAHFASGSATPSSEPKKFDPFLLRDSLKKRLNRALRTLGEDSETTAQIREIASGVHELAAADPEGAIASGLLDDEENYAIRHSLLTAILCDLTCTALDWPADKRLSVVCAALSMNAAVLDLQNKLVAQADALNPQQQNLMRSHPEAAANKLREAGVDDPLWLAAVQEHHRLGGDTGSPRALTQPGEAGQLVRLADVFGALVSQRGDRKPLAPPQALRNLLIQEGHGPWVALAGTLVKVLGLFPPGTYVKLANGEIAVVHRHGSAANAPLVASITNSNGNPYMKPLRRDTQNKEFAVAGLTLRGKLATGYDLGLLWVRTMRPA